MADDLRFVSVSEDDIENLLSNKLSDHTKRVVSGAVKMLTEYTVERNMSLSDLYELPKCDLNDFLRHFYMEARKKDGSLYTRNAIIAIRYGLQKHFSQTCASDIVNDSEFATSCEVFSAVVVSLKKQGKAATQHKQPLSSDDFNKLYTSNAVSTCDPKGLQNSL